MNEPDDNLVFARPSSEARDANGNSFWPPAQNGLSLRDYFAAKAMQGLLAGQGEEGWEPDAAAKMAYFVADAMLAERKAKR